MERLECDINTGKVVFVQKSGKEVVIDQQQFEMCLFGYLSNKAGKKNNGEITVPILGLGFKVKFSIKGPRVRPKFKPSWEKNVSQQDEEIERFRKKLAERL